MVERGRHILRVNPSGQHECPRKSTTCPFHDMMSDRVDMIPTCSIAEDQKLTAPQFHLYIIKAHARQFDFNNKTLRCFQHIRIRSPTVSLP